MESYVGFPIDVSNFRPLELGLESEIPYESLAVLQENIQIMRDVVITLTAVARAKGLGGHTGGPYDIVPEVLIIDALREGGLQYITNSLMRQDIDPLYNMPEPL